MTWTPDKIEDLSGKVAIVTGANSGIGFEAALVLAQKGAKVQLAVRTASKGEAAMEAIRQRVPKADLVLGSLDLADLESVERFADTQEDGIDLLLNNAGVMALPYCTTAQGFEMQFGTNHLGHFALTGRLFDKLAPNARVVNVSSMAHRMGKMRFHDLNWTSGYSRWPAYGQSKLSNLLFTYEASRRFRAAGSAILSVACHPGYSSTHLQTKGAEMDGSALKAWFMTTGNRLFAQSAEMGAQPTLFAATDPTVASGDYIGPSQAFEVWGPPKKVDSNARSKRLDDAKQLWDASMELTGVRWLPEG